MSSYVGLLLVLTGAVLVVVSIAIALLRSPRSSFDLDDLTDDTIAMPRLDEDDGALVRIEGRVIVPEPLYAPSGLPCALVEIYASERGGAARQRERRMVPFFVDDGMRRLRISPAVELTAFDLPTLDLDGLDGPDGTGEADALDDTSPGIIERHLEPGARVLIVGRISTQGAPGHEEFVLLPAEGASSVGLTFLAPPASRVNRSRTPLDGLPMV